MKRYRKKENGSILVKSRWFPQSETEWNDEVMYRVMLVFLAVVILAAAVFYLTPYFRVINVDQPCILRSMTGLYCPGCGGTRALRFLIHGQVAKSLYYNPAVGYVMIFVMTYMVSHILKHLTKGKIKGIHYRNGYCYMGVILLVLNWIWKNYMLLVYHRMLIP